MLLEFQQLVIIGGHRAGFRNVLILKMKDQQPQALTEPIKAAKEADEVAPIEDVGMQKFKKIKFNFFPIYGKQMSADIN